MPSAPSSTKPPTLLSSGSTASPALPADLASLFRAITPQQLSSVSSRIGMTSAEQSRVSTAMGDPAFLQLLADYAREMSDPEMKRQQEEALRAMEREAGMAASGGGAKTGNAGSAGAAGGKQAVQKQQSTTTRAVAALDLD